jgi:hypothetical protein
MIKKKREALLVIKGPQHLLPTEATRKSQVLKNFRKELNKALTSTKIAQLLYVDPAVQFELIFLE